MTWTNADWSSAKSNDIHIRAISQEMPQPSITKICLKITCLKFHSNFPGANELICDRVDRFSILEDNGMLNTLRPRQNDRQFTDNLFKCIFVSENVWILIKISLKFDPRRPINNIPALFQIMAWHQPGDKPLSEPMMVWFTDAYMHHLASMS